RAGTDVSVAASGVMGRVVVLVFFFSSRRRHTRSKRDWSSDVCSSDLRCTAADASDSVLARAGVAPGGVGGGAAARRSGPPERARSEERRVGKEWRWRWSRQPRQKER